jgi:hypothetical protein
MAAYQAPLGASGKPTSKPAAKRSISSRSAGSVLKPSINPHSEFWVAL